MAVRNILLYPEDEPLLRMKSLQVGGVNDEVRQLIRDLEDTLIASPRPGAGLSAPQIGVHKRVIVAKLDQPHSESRILKALVNPKIWKAGSPAKEYDGCLSIPNLVTMATSRPTWLRVRALNENGVRVELRLTGRNARVVHHEIDHLDGILFIDRLEDFSELLWEDDDGDESQLVKAKDHALARMKYPNLFF